MNKTHLSQARLSRFVVAAGILGVGGLLAGCGNRGGAEEAPGMAPEVAVVVMRPERITVTTELAGRASALLVAEVRPQVSGILQKRLFEEGEDVKAGDVLYQIDPAMYEAAYAGAKAALARAEANLKAIRLRAERYKDLVPSKAVSVQDYDDVTAALQQAEAEVEAGKATVESARLNLAYTRITAPISGRIGRSAVTIGALVGAYQPVALATIQQLDPIYVDVPQSTAELLRLQQRMAAGRLAHDGKRQKSAKLLMEDGMAYPMEGTLQFQDITVDPSTGSVIIRAVFPNPEHMLLPGRFVRMTFSEGVQEQAILVPQQGVARNPKGEAVALVVDEGGNVQSRILELDRALGDKWLVSSGLNPGDRVIVEGIQKARPGTRVTVVPFGETQAVGGPSGAPPADTK